MGGISSIPPILHPSTIFDPARYNRPRKGPAGVGSTPGLWPTVVESTCLMVRAPQGARMARLDPADAEAVMQAAGLIPQVPYPGAHAPWLCRCSSCGSEVQPRLVHVRKGHGCRVCGERKSTAAAQRRVNPDEAAALMRRSGLKPLVPYPGANRPWPCLCLMCNTEGAPRYAHVKARGRSCRTCKYAAQAVAQRGPEHAAVADMRAAGVEPIEPFPGLNRPWRCRCTACAHEVTPRLASIRQGQGGCKRCAGQVVDPDSAAAFMRSHDLEPLVDYPGGCIRWKCCCLRCGRVVFPRYSTLRLGKQGGCRWCAPWGFDPSFPAVVYLIAHQALGAVKIGVGRDGGRRLEAHRERGWEVHATVSVPGETAIPIEQAVLKWWRADLGLPPYLGREDMPQGGRTETVELDAVDIPETVRRIERLARELG